MVRTVIYFVLVALVAVGAVWLANNPGEVVITWQDYVIELSVVWLALVSLIVVFITVFLTQLWRWLRRGLREQRRLARYQRSFDELGWGLGALMANDGDRARRHAESFARLSDNAALGHIMVGQAALLQDDTAAAKTHFAELESDARTRPIALRGLLTIADQAGDTEAIYDLAEKAQANAPKANWSQRPFVEAAVELGRWDGAAKALRAAIAQGHLDPEDGRRMQAIVALCRAREVRREKPDDARRFVRDAMKQDPGLVPARVLAAELAHEKKRYRRAQRILRDGWANNPHPDLATAFIALRASDTSAQQYKRMNLLVSGGQKGAPPGPEGQYALARYALAAGLTGPARGHLAAMRDILPQRRAYQMLADVEALAGDADAEQAAKDRLATALPDPVWHCTSCGQEHVDWQAVCADCGDFASIIWATHAQKSPLPVLLEEDPSDQDPESEDPILLTSEVRDGD